MSIQDKLLKKLNPNLWYLVIDTQINKLTIKKGGDINKVRYLVPYKDSNGIMLSRPSQTQMQELYSKLLNEYKTGKVILDKRNEIVKLYKSN